MKKGVYKITILLIAIIIWFHIGNSASALSIEDVTNRLYEELVIQGKNSSEVKTTQDFSVSEISKALKERDDPNNFHDGMAITTRGPYYSINKELLIYKNGKRENKYTVELTNAYDIFEAEKVAKEAAREILTETGKDASDRIKLYALSDYVRQHLKYSKEQAKMTNSFLDEISEYREENLSKDEKPEFPSGVQNGIEALTSRNNGTICSGFAAVTCLIASEMGMDCKVVANKTHAYNMFRLDDDDKYIEWDLTGSRYGAVSHAEKIISGNLYKNSYNPSIYRNSLEVEWLPQFLYYISKMKFRSVGDLIDVLSAFPITLSGLVIAIRIGLPAIEAFKIKQRKNRRRSLYHA